MKINWENNEMFSTRLYGTCFAKHFVTSKITMLWLNHEGVITQHAYVHRWHYSEVHVAMFSESSVNVKLQW